MAQEIGNSNLLEVWATSGQVVEPDISKIEEGWQLGEQPPHEFMNWLQNTFGAKLNQILSRGAPDWNSETLWPVAALVNYSGRVWLALSANTNSQPSDVNSNWKTIDDAKSILYDNSISGLVAENVQAAISELQDKKLAINDLATTTGASEDTAMTQKAATDEFGTKVSLTGDQVIEGVKTFSSFPVTPSAAPTEEYQAVNKKYVDDSVIDLFVKPVRGKPLLEKTGVTSVKIPAGLAAMVGSTLITLNVDIMLSLDSNLVGSVAVAGTDYFVYLKDDATAYISASDVEPEGRLIAGFHYGLTGHTETPSGNKTESDMVKLRGINAHTFWDLTFRANKWTNRGLTFDGINWIDIYLADEEYAVRGWSKAGGWIAGGTIEYGRKFPVIPEMFGGNGSATYGKLTPFVAWDMLNAAGMEPIGYKQFAHAMYGVEEGLPASGIETVIGKIEHYPRLTSRFGVEQATGVQWIWGADFGGSSSGTWQGVTDSRGQVYSGVIVSLYGADRDYAAGRPGSRASSWNNGLTYSSWYIGVRGLRDHLNLDIGDDSRRDE